MTRAPLRFAVLALLALLAAPCAAAAQTTAPDTTVRVTVGGFVDGYFAYDFDRPRALDRPYTTQAARHDEFNVNLAHLEAVLAGSRVRGRVAAQFGTSVQANYAAEPTVGTLSGPSVSRFIQEATAGYRVARAVWVDGGVFFSPFGSESWISRDNWTYTRSFIADNSPYYEAGVKATWQARPHLSAQLHVINGWQNVSETNSDKALGARVDYTPKAGVDVAYDAFVGNEQPDSLPRCTRVWQEAIVQLEPTSRLGLRGTFDYGTQARAAGAPGGGTSAWRGYAVIARYRLAPNVAVAGRWEGYSDPERVIVATGQPFGLRVRGGSANVDVTPVPRLLWRTELRAVRARDPLFTRRDGAGTRATRRDACVVTSLALTF